MLANVGTTRLNIKLWVIVLTTLKTQEQIKVTHFLRRTNLHIKPACKENNQISFPNNFLNHTIVIKHLHLQLSMRFNRAISLKGLWVSLVFVPYSLNSSWGFWILYGAFVPKWHLGGHFNLCFTFKIKSKKKKDWITSLI